MNTTKITAENFAGVVFGWESLFIPYQLPALEGVNYTLKFESNNEFADFDGTHANYRKFLNELDFGINVAIGSGWDAMEQHIRRNGFGGVKFVGLVKTEDFIKNASQDVLNEIDVTLFN